jgi:succinate dehydrogenase / fumarate reductase iron-sulfur subunit
VSQKVVVRVQRQDSPGALESRRFEDFSVEIRSGDSVATLLHAIADDPVTTEGHQVAPVAFESACRAARCSACTILVNAHAAVACRTSVESVRPKRGPIVLAPMSKFPLIRDLIVDRSPLRDAGQRLGAWLDEPPAAAPLTTFALSEIDRCTNCGACFEACPETSGKRFVGAAALNEARLANELSAGGPRKPARLDASMNAGGVAKCGKARVCVEVCPERIPLFDSILSLERETTRRWLATLLRR